MIVISDKPIKCDDCGDTITAEQMKTDEVRVHKTRSGIFLCECCYEDYLERRNDD